MTDFRFYGKFTAPMFLNKTYGDDTSDFCGFSLNGRTTNFVTKGIGLIYGYPQTEKKLSRALRK